MSAGCDQTAGQTSVAEMLREKLCLLFYALLFSCRTDDRVPARKASRRAAARGVPTEESRRGSLTSRQDREPDAIKALLCVYRCSSSSWIVGRIGS